jgi:hypothetical protein
MEHKPIKLQEALEILTGLPSEELQKHVDTASLENKLAERFQRSFIAAVDHKGTIVNLVMSEGNTAGNG